MRNAKLIFILLAGIAVTLPTGAQDQTSKPKYEPLRLSFPKRFPASQHRLLRLRDTPGKKAKARIRAHAWDLFAGLTRESIMAKELPIWDTWYTKCDLGLADCGTKFLEEKLNLHRSLRNFEVPVQSLEELQSLSLGPGEQSFAAQSSSDAFQKRIRAFAIRTRTHPQFASVLFNREAADAIRKQCLYAHEGNLSAATSSCPSLPATGKIKEFRRGAVALKTFWQLVIADANGIGQLETWKQELWNNIQQPNDNNIDRFRTSTVRVDTKSTAECENRDYGDDEVVPLKCFYAIQLTQEDVDALNASPPRLVAISDTGIIPGNYLVLVAVHVTTKEIPDWVWATFWWDNHGISDPRAAERPKTIKPRWSHFLMETTLSGTTPLETDGGPKICFNPYLETPLRNGAISNCLQCHSKAAYGPPSRISAYDLGVLGRDGKTLASGKAPDPHYFDNRVQTDFIWSIANSLNSNDIQPLMHLFQQNLHDLQLQELQLRQQENAPPPKQ
ncbi:MAG TPA: hypothetical protein VFR24_10225 [Candidatus Angelobacter sp.]|nr:hypothetical protein [Candidatus Angelobacter sp.]